MMKASKKAALLSAFVFPGVGHFHLKKYGRGLVIMFISLSAIIFLVWQATSSALNHLDKLVVKMQSGTTTSLQEIADIAASQASTKSSYYEAVFYFIACVWIFTVVDAYRIGKQRDMQDKENPMPNAKL